MRKRVFGRKFKRDTNERKALFRSLMGSLVLQGRIKTSEAKAKAIKGEVEKLITRAKNHGEDSRRIIMARLVNEKATDKIIAEIAPKFTDRPGGYTRILKLGPRIKDGAERVLLTWVEEISKTSQKEPKRNPKKSKLVKPVKTTAKTKEIKSKEKPKTKEGKI